MGATVNLDSGGSFLLASDAVSLRQNLDADTVPRNTWNADALLKSFADIRRIEKSGATVVCGHDEAQWQGLRRGAEAYE
jgi:glyoxylase-like metal-dependent hydrolase (beta-lactamase superfamily II)